MDKRLKMGQQVMQLTLKWTLFDQICENVFYARKSSFIADVQDDHAVTDADAANQASNLGQAYNNSGLMGFTGPQASLNSVDWVWNESVDVGPLHEGTVSGGDFPFVGTNTDDCAPSNVTIALKLSTGLGGRSRHGRFYLVGLSSGTYLSTAPDVIKAGSAATLPDTADALRGFYNNDDLIAGTGDKFQLVVASFVEAGVLRSEVLTTPVSRISPVDFFIDSQRRRLLGRGA